MLVTYVFDIAVNIGSIVFIGKHMFTVEQHDPFPLLLGEDLSLFDLKHGPYVKHHRQRSSQNTCIRRSSLNREAFISHLQCDQNRVKKQVQHMIRRSW